MSTAAAAIRYRLIRQSFVITDKTFAGVAKALKVSRGMITHVAKGRRVSRRVRYALARALGMSYRKLWEE